MPASAIQIRNLTTGVLLLAAGLQTARGAIIVNGGLESQVVSGLSTAYGGGVDAGILTGWQASGNTSTYIVLINGPYLGLSAIEGAQFVSFNGGDSPSGGILSQTFSTTIGDTYDVSYTVGRYGSGAALSLHGEILSGSNAVLGQADNTPVTTGWLTPTTFSFTATTASTTIRFTDTSTGTIGTDVALDAISVTRATPVPEPESCAAAAGVALVVLGVSRRFTIR